MIRKIIKIDSEKCNGCTACVTACHEGAIDMIDGKAHLLREDYCDGLGDCLPVCPTGAITIDIREAELYDVGAVRASGKDTTSPRPCACFGVSQNPKPCASSAASASQDSRRASAAPPSHKTCACPGTATSRIKRDGPSRSSTSSQSRLLQWPVQIKLVPANAPYLKDADLLIAADCTAYAYGSFHSDFMRGRITLIGCPKLDEGDYTDKLSEIIATNAYST